MKKLLYIPILLIFILTFSCRQTSAEKKLNGKWYETENPKIFWIFHPDYIEFIYRTYIWDSLGKTIHTEDEILIEYKLSKNEDTLSGTLTNSYGKHKFGLIKTE